MEAAKGRTLSNLQVCQHCIIQQSRSHWKTIIPCPFLWRLRDEFYNFWDTLFSHLCFLPTSTVEDDAKYWMSEKVFIFPWGRMGGLLFRSLANSPAMKSDTKIAQNVTKQLWNWCSLATLQLFSGQGRKFVTISWGQRGNFLDFWHWLSLSAILDDFLLPRSFVSWNILWPCYFSRLLPDTRVICRTEFSRRLFFEIRSLCGKFESSTFSRKEQFCLRLTLTEKANICSSKKGTQNANLCKNRCRKNKKISIPLGAKFVDIVSAVVSSN